MKALKLFTLLCLTFNTLTYANEDNTLDSYISGLKQKQFRYEYEKNEAESSKLRDSWIAPLQLNYSYIKNRPYDDELKSQSATIRINQPIFQGGGIYYGIKFANASKLYSDYTIDVARRKMIKETIALLMQIKQQELRIKAQNLQIKNAEINLAQKKEQYLNGQLDSGFLDNAIIQRNILIQALYDMQTAEERLINHFTTLSDLDYKHATIPHLEYISAKKFLKHNIVLKQTDALIEKNLYAKDVRIAKYLPRVSFTAGYNWNNSEQQFKFKSNIQTSTNDSQYYDYGIRINMPLDLNAFRDIESAKIDFLKARVVAADRKREFTALFEQVLKNIENFDKKITLSKENIDLYSKLLTDTKRLFKAGYKTEYDVETLSNSLKIQELDTQIYEIDKQLELLNLYEMYVEEGK